MDTPPNGYVKQKAIKNAFLQEWDPIGIGDLPEAHDQYDQYIPEVYSLLLEKRPTSEVFNYLWWLETDRLGLSGKEVLTKKFAERLIILFAENCE